MIYQPRNVQPSGTSVDGSKTNTYSVELQTNSAVTKYDIYFKSFDGNENYHKTATLSTPLYNGEKLSINIAPSDIRLSNGKDYKWYLRLYQNDANIKVTYGNVQKTSTTTTVYLQPNINIRAGMSIQINNQVKAISAYNISTGAATVAALSSAPAVGTAYTIVSNFIDTTPDYIVYARSTPSLSISNAPSTVTTKFFTFRGQYSQNEGIPIIYHIFDIYIQNDDGTKTLVDTSGKVYSANLTYTYDSFRTGNTYFVKLTTENDMGVLSETPLYDFRVNYNVVEYLQQPTAKFLDKENAIEVSWVAPVEHDAQSYDSAGRVVAPAFLYNTPYSGVNSLYSEGYDTVWQTPDGLCVLPENFNITFQFSPDQHFYYGEDGLYIDEAVLIDSETDGNEYFTIKLNKNKLIFTYGTLTLEKMLYTHTSDAFVLNPTGVAQINDDYVWLDTATWNDDAIWTEGGTALERVCNHWWKIQITNSTIKVEEIFPSA